MIKIAYDHQVFGFQEYGGVSRYFYEVARRVCQSPGVSAAVIAPLYVNRYLLEAGATVFGIHIPNIAKTTRVVSAINRMLSSGFVKAYRPDVLHETYYQDSSSAPKGCPSVVTVYDMIHEKFSTQADPLEKVSAAKRSAVARADRVICISENTRKDLIDLFHVDPKKTKTIHLGFSLTKSASPAVPPALDRPFFLYVGQRQGYKNFGRLLEAYASSYQLRNEFDLISFGTSAFTSLENEAIRAFELHSTQVRHLSGDDGCLAYLYRRATAFVYPSLYEGFGLPPLEAMSMGCPVLCSNTSSMPEVVGDAGLYFDPSDSQAIRQAMERVAASAELRLDLISRGTERLGHFSYDRCADETLGVYRDLIQ